MAAIRGRDTKPELQIRRAVHAAGLRFRLHVEDLPGKPDLVFPRHRAAVFVNGCFWHLHGCSLFKWPRARERFWREKITRNAENDRRAFERLRATGWRVAIVWECALKGKTRLDPNEVATRLACWIRSDEETLIVEGK